MPWIYALVGLLVGTLLGVIISRLTTPGYKKQKSTQKELETAKFELEQQKQDLADHFAQTAEMLDSLGKEYTKLYQHMTKTSSELLPNLPDQDNPFNKKVAEVNDAAVVCISADLPFAMARFCGAEGIENVQSASFFRSPEFAEAYGVKLAEGPLAGLAARAVVVLDEEGRVIHSELVSEITDVPNYDAAMEALG